MPTEITSCKGTFSGSLADAAAWIEEYQPAVMTLVVDGREMSEVEMLRCEDENGMWDGAEIVRIAKLQGRTHCTVCGDSAVCTDDVCPACTPDVE